MSKSSSYFQCQECGWQSPRWVGQCAECGAWNTLVEEVVVARASKTGKPVAGLRNAAKISLLSEVTQKSEIYGRISTTIDELDRVLGGDQTCGLVPGEVVLLGGEPGIGKSTLLTQVVLGMLTNYTQNSAQQSPIVYVAGEESPQQIAVRINRLRSHSSNNENRTKKKRGKVSTLTKYDDRLLFATTTDVDELVALILQSKPALVVVDSVQTLTTSDLSGTAGSIGQVKEVTTRLVSIAKQLHTPLFLVGHVTKEGRLAGPMLLEHMVDAVLELTGDRSSELRLLRAVKNRFGATDEVGVFRMTGEGYEQIDNPSQFFLETRDPSQSGSTIGCVLEGTRPLLVEVQALTTSSYLPQPRRVGRGILSNRLHILAAVLEKHCGIPLSKYDVFVSVAGGFETKEAVLDLAICVALASSINSRSMPEGAVFVGEVGLLGEIRSTPMLERRAKEARRLGFSSVYSRKTHTSLRSLLRELDVLRAK